MSVERTLRFGIIFGAAACAAGCAVPSRVAGLSNAPVDSSSPVAKDVIYASEHPGPYPRFADIPKIPTDVRPASAWRAAIAEVQHKKAVLEAEVAALPAVTADTETYASQTRAQASAPASQAAPTDPTQQTEAYARSLRERATPPPPPK